MTFQKSNFKTFTSGAAPISVLSIVTSFLTIIILFEDINHALGQIFNASIRDFSLLITAPRIGVAKPPDNMICHHQYSRYLFIGESIERKTINAQN